MRGSLNLSVDRINSIDELRIALFKEFSLFGFPNKRVLTILRKLGNIRKISNLGGDIAQCLVFLQDLRLCQ